MAPSRWAISPMLMFSVGILVLSAFNYGFSDQAFASCQAMDSFTRQFGVYSEKMHKYKLEPLFKSLYNSLKAGGQILGLFLLSPSHILCAHCSVFSSGVFLGGYVSNTYGRRMCIFVMSVYALGSTSVVISSKTVAQIQAARALHCEFHASPSLGTVPDG